MLSPDHLKSRGSAPGSESEWLELDVPVHSSDSLPMPDSCSQDLKLSDYNVALTADLEKVFLMVSVVEKDCEVLRFLRVKDLKMELPEVNIYRFMRVVFGVSSSPFLLNATIRTAHC